MLIPSLLVGLICDIIGYEILNSPIYRAGDTHTLGVLTSDSFSVVTFAGNLLFVQQLLVPCFGSNGALWSVAYEFWFYIWFPTLFFALKGKPSIFLASLFIAIMFPTLLFYFGIWLLGYVVFLLSQSPVPRVVSNSAVGYVTFGISFIVFIISILVSKLQTSMLGDLFMSISFGTLLCVGLTMHGPLPRAPRIIKEFGARASFSLYAVHLPILILTVAVFGWPRKPPNLVYFGLIVILSLAMCILAYGFSQMTERHTSKIRSLIHRMTHFSGER